FLLTAEQKYLIELLGVGSNVVMSKQNAFGIAGAAAGEDDGGNVVKGRFSLSADGFFNPACRHEREQQRADPLSKTGIGGNFFQQRAFHWWARLDAFKKCFGTDNGFQAALSNAGSNHFIGSGVIQVHRYFAHEQRGIIHQSATDRGRQQDADFVLPLPNCAQTAREINGASQCATKADFWGLSVSHGKAPAISFCRPDKGALNRL